MVYEVTSTKDLAGIDAALRESAAAHKFGILHVHNLKETMRSKGVDFASECLVYEVCNPHQAKKVLEANGAVSTALPCRISVYKEGDVYKVATLKPTAILSMFAMPELASVALEVEQVIVAMMHAAQ
jgi:uncharacterized protein (DUF302 family)